MPMTLWSEIAGEYCDDCGELATHHYGTIKLCCLCHAGSGSENRLETAKAHVEALKKRVKELEKEQAITEHLVLHYQGRISRLKSWANLVLPEPHVTQLFNILANGKPEVEG